MALGTMNHSQDLAAGRIATLQPFSVSQPCHSHWRTQGASVDTSDPPSKPRGGICDDFGIVEGVR